MYPRKLKWGIRKMAKALLPAKIFVDMNARFRTAYI